jgi:hypothetical protein
VPLDPATGKPHQLSVRLEIDERQYGMIDVGQPVRFRSAMYPHRLHGEARGTIERLEPMATPGPDGSRMFIAWARISDSPFDLKLGASVKAEVVVGRKRLVRIILEH